MEKIKLTVDGMSCAHCEKAVEDVLAELGAEKVKASAKKGFVKLQFDVSKISPDAIRQGIAGAGYTVLD